MKCAFIGYSLESKAYRLHESIKGKVIIIRDVVFNEDESWAWEANESIIQRKVFLQMNLGLISVLACDTLTNEAAKQFGLNRQNDQAGKNVIYAKLEVQSTPRRVRSLRKICESCTFTLVMSDLVIYEDDKDVQIWRKTMQE